MPQADGYGPRRSIPGLYRSLRDRAVRAASEPDPRVMLLDDGGQRRRLIEADRIEAALEPARRRAKTWLDLDGLEAGQPVEVPKWMLGGNRWPQPKLWPEGRDRTVTGWLVQPDDRVQALRG